MKEQDAVNTGYEADVTAHLLDTNGKKIGVTGLLDTGSLISVLPVKTWEGMGFRGHDLFPTNLRLSAVRSNLRGWENTDNSPPHWRTKSMDEFPCGREPGRFRSLHFGSRLSQKLRRDDRPDQWTD